MGTALAAPVAVLGVLALASALSLTAAPPAVAGANCTDTDGGIVPNVFGTVFTGAGNFSDACIGNATLTEYYCDSNQTAKGRTARCSAWMNSTNSTCILGACT